MKGANDHVSKGAASGMAALVFLVLGFQLAIFVVKVVEIPGQARNDVTYEKAASAASEAAGGVQTRERFSSSESIDNYRSKGGRFRSKDDFRKMYVVSDTLFTRLEPFIKIPKVELNAADSAALVSLRGIGPYYAHKILEYRERLGGFLYKAQLLEIEGFDEERLAGFSDDIEIDTTLCNHLDLWNATERTLARHPYLGEKGARSIARYKSLYDTTRWTLADLEHERVIPKENIEKLKKYIEIQ